MNRRLGVDPISRPDGTYSNHIPVQWTSSFSPKLRWAATKGTCHGGALVVDINHTDWRVKRRHNDLSINLQTDAV